MTKVEWVSKKIDTFLKLSGLGGDSQNFLCKFVRFFVTLGLKILRLFMLKVLFEADVV